MNDRVNAQAVAVDYDPFATGDLQRAIATTEAQREVWLADKLAREASLAFNEAATLRLRGPLDLRALHAALDALVARHEALRAAISADGAQLLVAAQQNADWSLVDLASEPPAVREAALARAQAAAVELPFDLERGPLLRAQLLRLAAEDHVLLLCAHHVVCDGWSYGVILADLGALYAEALGVAPGPAAAIGYGDYVAWEAAEAASPAMAGHERFWLDRFAGGALPLLELPTDRPRAAQRSFASRRIDRTLDAELMASVRKMGGKHGASSFATLFATFAATLHRITGQDDLVIGVPAAGQSASGLHTMVGHCVNLLPVRTFVDAAQPFATHLQATASTLLDAFEHQSLTFGTLLQKLPLKRDPSRLPLVSVMFNVDQAVASTSDAFPGLTVAFAAVPRHFENFELFINAAQVNGGLRLECQFNTDLFDGETVARWLEAYETLLRAAVATPTQPIATLGLLSPAQQQRVLALQPARTPYPSADLMHSAFVRQAQATPSRIALQTGSERLRYDELERRSNQLAHALRARGVGRGSRVGLCLARGNDMVVGVLGVLKTGAAYVPLDPGFPQARLAYYAEDAALSLLVTQSSLAVAPRAWCSDAAQRLMMLDAADALAGVPDCALPPGPQDAQPNDAAYVIYTSGSTGKPKGVCVPHAAVVNFLVSMAQAPGMVADDVLAAVTTLSFDIAVLELMLPLTVGAKVVIVPRETAMDGNLLRGLLTDSQATFMQATPGMWRLLLDTDWHGGAGFKALVGGEGLPPDLAQALAARTGALWNMYGPTETTVWSTLWRVDPVQVARQGVSIGRPIANTTVWILDGQLQLCPIGVPGEICIGGDGVTLGYLDRPELNDDRFKPDPFAPGARLYRTGDRGRWRNDGLLEHQGRMDFQVKVRGYRIELGEIESVCNELPTVAQTVVLAREDQPGDVRLVAYLTARGAGFDEAALKAHLKTKLPDYMLPQHVVVLDAIPLLPNGKVDRKALPAPDLSASLPKGERVAARNDLEQGVLATFESILKLPGLGVTDDFFALGGHSLLAARLTSRLNRDFDLNLPLRTLFESPTVEQLAVAVEKARTSGTPKRAPIEHRTNQGAAPLTVMQERIRFLEELYPGRVVYNTPSAHRLTGPFDRAAFERAFRTVVDRQPSLRTSIVRDQASGQWLQRVPAHIDFDLPYADLSALPEPAREVELMRELTAIIDTPMDIHAAPLFRVGLWKLRDDQHAFLFMPHHIIWDGWSFDLMYEEMSGIYGAYVEGREHALAPLSVTYGDYAQWHAAWSAGPEAAQQLAYWKDRFAKSPQPKAPPTDRPRQASMSGAGATEWIRIDKAATERLYEIARSADATLNMLTMAVYAAMMSRAIGSEHVAFGIPVRGRLMMAVEPIMGFFNNLVALQLKIDPQRPFRQFVRDIKGELLDAFAHQDLPFEQLAAEPEVAARAQRVGLYQALFSYQDARDRKRDWGGLKHQSILVFQKGATEDLGLWLMETPNGIEGGFIYNADIFTADTAKLFHARYQALLARVMADPDLTLGAMSAVEATELAQLAQWSAALPGAPTVLDAAGQLTPIGVEGRLYKNGLATDQQARWAADGTLQVREAKAARTPAAASQRQAMTPTEQTLAEVWSQLLSVSDVRLQDNFFELGGSSLLAMQAAQAMETRIGKRITARKYVFDDLRALARSYDEAETLAPPLANTSGGLVKRLSGLFRRT